MIQQIKEVFKDSPLYIFMLKRRLKTKQLDQYRKWQKNGRKGPPPHLHKQEILKYYVDRYHLKVFIETGTYYGEMVEAMMDQFESIFSIELSPKFANLAKRRFRGKKKVVIIQGDSSVEIGKIVNQIKQPALFWLDGHFSQGDTAKGEKVTPIFEELDCIFKAVGEIENVILIDDARLFGLDPDYPSLDEVFAYVKSKKDLDILVQEDVIRITPKSDDKMSLLQKGLDKKGKKLIQ